MNKRKDSRDWYVAGDRFVDVRDGKTYMLINTSRSIFESHVTPISIDQASIGVGCDLNLMFGF